MHIDFQSATDDISKCQNGTLNCTLEELAIINAIADNPSITQKELAEKINSTERTIKRRTVEMQKKGLIQRIGGKRNGYWKVLKDIRL